LRHRDFWNFLLLKILSDCAILTRHEGFFVPRGAATGGAGKMPKIRVADKYVDGASIAGLLITTEAMVAELPKKESPAMPGGGGMGGMGGMDY
jgi:hypothetical protein